MKSLLLAGAALLLAAAPAPASVPTSSPAPARVPTTDVSPGQLTRGEDVGIPHLEGRVIVDGDTRIRVDARRVSLLGRSGSAYVVHTNGKDGASGGRTYRVFADGSTKLLGRARQADELILSEDGLHLIRVRTHSRERTTILVRNARNGGAITARTYHGWLTPLAASDGQVLLSSWSPARTMWWNYVGDVTPIIARRTGGVADVAADRLGTYTGDPYDGGCFVLSALSDPSDVLWRTCSERVVAISPDGRRVATIGILSDGLGPNVVTVRRSSGGALLARYSATWFGEVRWESDTALLLDANGERKSATIRCVLDDCERASDLEPAPQY